MDKKRNWEQSIGVACFLTFSVQVTYLCLPLKHFGLTRYKNLLLLGTHCYLKVVNNDSEASSFPHCLSIFKTKILGGTNVSRYTDRHSPRQ